MSQLKYTEKVELSFKGSIIFQGDPNWMRWAKNSISFNPVLLKKMSICPGFIYVHEIKCLLSAYQVPDTILGKKGDVSVQD